MSKRKPITADQWLNANSPYTLLKHLQVHQRIAKRVGGKRKLRLWSVGCCRSAWHLITNETCRRAIEISERAADGQAKRTEVRAATAEVNALVIAAQDRANPLLGGGVNFRNTTPELKALMVEQAMAYAASYTVSQTRGVLALQIVTSSIAQLHTYQAGITDPDEQAKKRTEVDRFHCDLIRDVYGNAFWYGNIDPRWLSSTVLDVARAIYLERAFDRMPILADALMDAGCDSEEILNHCRRPGPHVRGCWVVDLLLSKE